MRFINIALAMVKRGIPVIPLKPNSKLPALVAHGVLDATLNIEQIEAWDKTQPNCNCAAAASPDGCWFLDIDDMSMVKGLLVDCGQFELPNTFTVKTTRGLHLYFKQNDVSRAMGNQRLGVCDAQIENKYVVAPGSMHPSGAKYEILIDTDILEAPEWLITWLSKKGSASAPKGVAGVANASSVDESLIWLNAWMNRCSVDALEKPHNKSGGGCHIYVSCSQKALHTTESGPSETAIIITADGKFGFNCQHSHCGDLTWQKFRATYEMEPEITNEHLVQFSGVSGPENVAANQAKGEWRFNTAALYGPLGRLALSLRVPLGLVFPALLTAYSVNVPDTPDVRTNQYCALVAAKGEFKGESAARACEALHVPTEDVSLASNRGVEQVLAGGGRVLVYQDEFEGTVRKMSIQGSNLAHTLCTLWSGDKSGTADKKGINSVTARMSLLGNVAINKQSEFKAVFMAETTKGLYDRFIFGCRNKGEHTEYTRRSALHLEDVAIIPAVTVQVADIWFTKMNEWRRAAELEFSQLGSLGRMGDILMRTSVCLASSNGETEMSQAAFDAAAAFCGWQCRIRQYYSPSDAINLGAQIGESIAAYLAKFPGASVPRKKLLKHAQKEMACSARDVLQEFHAMVQVGSIEHEEDDDGLDVCYIREIV
jgi:hypothetical protein